MPKGFENCVAKGGKVITKSLSKGRYIHFCKLGGKWYRGEVKTKQKETKGGR